MKEYKQQKYELTDETIFIPREDYESNHVKVENPPSTETGVTLHRIKALVDIPEHGVKAGDLGGFVESMYNLSQIGHAWVANEAKVFQAARAIGGALIKDNAQAYGASCIHDDVILSDNAKVFDSALLVDCATISNNAVVCNDAVVGGEVIVRDSALISDSAYVDGRVIAQGDVIITGESKVGGDITIDSGFHANLVVQNARTAHLAPGMR